MLIPWMGDTIEVEDGEDLLDHVATMSGALSAAARDLATMGEDIQITKDRVDRQASALANGGGGGGAAAAALVAGLAPRAALPPATTVPVPVPANASPHRNTSTPPVLGAGFVTPAYTPSPQPLPCDRTFTVTFTPVANLAPVTILFTGTWGTPYASPPKVLISEEGTPSATAYAVAVTATGFTIGTRAGVSLGSLYRITIVTVPSDERFD